MVALNMLNYPKDYEKVVFHFGSSLQYDQFGFSVVPPGRDNDLVAHAHSLQRKSEELTVKVCRFLIRVSSF